MSRPAMQKIENSITPSLRSLGLDDPPSPRGPRSIYGIAPIAVGTYDTIKTLNATLPIDEGFPAYFPEARAYVSLIDTSRQQFFPGFDDTGDGTALNVRALYQRCPHLGCKPNPCLKNFWFECPCHGSRYDRLGIKAEGAQYGPAPRGLDRFSVTVGNDGVLTIDTGRITLGPLPIAVGQPGIIPPRTPTGCI